MELSPVERRVLGSLVEKQLATPQYYPLTLNSLVAACNQSSNRDPVTSYGGEEVMAAVDSLRDKGLARIVHSSPGSRTTKYRHVLDERWGLDDAHRAVLAVLLLRGPQTLGELRARTERMASFDSTADVEEVVGLLAAREEPLVAMLERAPGQKEARVTHLLASPDQPAVAVAVAPAGAADPATADRATAVPGGLAERVAGLERDVMALQAELDRLRALLE